MGPGGEGKYADHPTHRTIGEAVGSLGIGFEESGKDAGTIGRVLTWIVGALHLVSAFSLIGLVLLHSGKGGGVSDMFGGSVGATAAGSTVAEKNLSRITVVVAVTFGFTTLVLGLLLA
ncbi:MAG TPA: preprotein translocase subunit SecG [Acidimicrobiaceae bacterium]|nr:preprotein translocase subunit SecG [Acidimicrobiaceae bacterium]|tara:strand:+ start:1120 stop:1473 length:354 start_codon:yes stop_codon:yes gene_type:complete